MNWYCPVSYIYLYSPKVSDCVIIVPGDGAYTSLVEVQNDAVWMKHVTLMTNVTCAANIAALW